MLQRIRGCVGRAVSHLSAIRSERPQTVSPTDSSSNTGCKVIRAVWEEDETGLDGGTVKGGGGGGQPIMENYIFLFIFLNLSVWFSWLI